MDGGQARAAAAKRPTKRAMGLLREAVRLLAEEADGADVIGAFELQDGGDVESVAASLTVALSERGPMHVQIIAAPARRTPRPH